MNRIYYQGSFKLATDWPEEPKPNAFGRVHLLREDSYLKAVASAMKNGVEFANQDKVLTKLITSFQIAPEIGPEEGDNWDCPENVEISHKCKRDYDSGNYCKSPHCYEEPDEDTDCRIAIFKSESVEKKENPWRVEEDANGPYLTNGHLWFRKLEIIRDFLNEQYQKLTAPESSPTQYAGNGGTQCLECGAIYSKDAWDKCPFCSKSVLNAQTGQSSPAPLESQEELWSNIITSVFHGETNIGLQSKFILTRRKKVSPDLNKYKDLEDSY